MEWSWNRSKEIAYRTVDVLQRLFGPVEGSFTDIAIEFIGRRDERITSQVLLRSYLMLLAVCLVGYLYVATVSFVRRLLAGATIRDLLVNGSFEWIPARGLHFTIAGCLFVYMVGSFFATLTAGLQLFGSLEGKRNLDPLSSLNTLLITALSLVVAVGIFVFYKRVFLDVREIRPPRVEVEVSSIRSFRDAGDTSRIGTEKFPNRVSPFYGIGILTRRLLNLLVVISALLQVFVLVPLEKTKFSEHRYLEHLICRQVDLQRLYSEQVFSVRYWELPKAASLVLTYFCFSLLLILLLSNRHYLLFTFPKTLVYIVLLVSAIWTLVCSLGPIGKYDLEIVYGTTLFILAMLWLRWNSDLRLAASHKNRKRFLDPVSNFIQGTVDSFLYRVQKDPYCKLPELDLGELSERITKGAFNIEEGDYFVTRFFGRYMRVASVATERSTTASSRFMSINRFTELGHYWPSHGKLVDPIVPVWDETLFPIYPPDGFQTRRDSLRLPDRWNPIYYCPPTEWKTEHYTETEYYSEWDSSSNTSVSKSRTVTRTRQVEVTCTKCNGTSRLEFARYLVTTWKSNRPTVVCPHMTMPELVENAEEDLYYRLPIIEHGSKLSGESELAVGQEALLNQMEIAGAKVFKEIDHLCNQVLGLTKDKYVYRADFIIGGMHMMNIRFAFLRARSGWFFGRRPEFHFPRLPVGWATIMSWVLLTPLAITLWLTIAFLMLSFAIWATGDSLSTTT